MGKRVGEQKSMNESKRGGLQSRDYDDARKSDGGQEVKSVMDEMEESQYCTTLDAISRERYKQKI